MRDLVGERFASDRREAEGGLRRGTARISSRLGQERSSRARAALLDASSPAKWARFPLSVGSRLLSVCERGRDSATSATIIRRVASSCARQSVQSKGT